jgi:hypothetical protein
MKNIKSKEAILDRAIMYFMGIITGFFFADGFEHNLVFLFLFITVLLLIPKSIISYKTSQK